ECVSFPSADGVAVPPGLWLSLRRQLTAVHVDVTKTVIRLVEDDDQCRRLDDFPGLRLHVELRDSHRQTIRVGVISIVYGHAALLQFRRPRCECQAAGNVRADIEERGKRWRLWIRWKRWSRRFDDNAGPICFSTRCDD